jgi:hypothetical protein
MELVEHYLGLNSWSNSGKGNKRAGFQCLQVFWFHLLS